LRLLGFRAGIEWTMHLIDGKSTGLSGEEVEVFHARSAYGFLHVVYLPGLLEVERCGALPPDRSHHRAHRQGHRINRW
jgi:hypothetical protein